MTWTIDLPPQPLLNANQRLHHHRKAEVTRRLRGDAGWLARRAGVPALERAVVLAYVHPSHRGRIDPPNWHPSVKAAVDGLVDAGVIPDDDHARLVGPYLFRADATGRRGDVRLRLVVSEAVWRCGCGHEAVEHVLGCARPGCGCAGYRGPA